MRWLCLPILAFSTSALAWPYLVKIGNDRDNDLIVSSEKHQKETRIAKGRSLELLVQSEDDWVIRYASGAAGVRIWNLDAPLRKFIDNYIATTPESGSPSTLCMLSFVLRPDAVGHVWTSYTLEGLRLLNTGIDVNRFLRMHAELFDHMLLSETVDDYLAVDNALTFLSDDSNLLSEMLIFVRRQREALQAAVPANATQTLAGEVTRQLVANPLIPAANVPAIAEILLANINSQQ